MAFRRSRRGSIHGAVVPAEAGLGDLVPVATNGPSADMTIRIAEPSDAEAIAAIYAPVVRDTAMYSIVRSEWPGVRIRLESALGAPL